MSRKHRDRSWVPLDEVMPAEAACGSGVGVELTDNHTHLPVPGLPDTGPGSQAPRTAAQLVEQAAQVGVTRVITSACEQPAWEPSINLARSLSGVRVAAAIHPNEAVLHAGVREIGPDGLEPAVAGHHALPLEEAMTQLEAVIRCSRDVVVAVGETGLDFFRTGEQGRRVQEEAFRAHIALAKECQLPLQIHDRDAHEDCVRILISDGAPEFTVFHCFSGGPELAQACADNGWYASIAGPITYPANDDLRQAVTRIPLERLLVETDAPYLPPVPWRGRPNASYMMGQTVRYLAQLRGVDEEELRMILQRNTTRVYGSWEGAR